MISMSYTEAVTVSQNGRSIADYFEHKWREEGRTVNRLETTVGVTVTTTKALMFNSEGDQPEEPAETPKTTTRRKKA